MWRNRAAALRVRLMVGLLVLNQPIEVQILDPELIQALASSEDSALVARTGRASTDAEHFIHP